MPDIWYYSVAGQEIGPVTLGELKQRLPSFPNAEDVLVWHASFTEWLPVTDVAPLITGERPLDALPQATIGTDRFAATAGRLLGGMVCVIGGAMFYLGITGQEDWIADIFESSSLVAAAPGVLMLLLGMSLIRATRQRPTA
jgi:hypothetical protein